MYSVFPSVFFVFATLVMFISSTCSFLNPSSSLRNSVAVLMSVSSLVSLLFLSMSSVFMGNMPMMFFYLFMISSGVRLSFLGSLLLASLLVLVLVLVLVLILVGIVGFGGDFVTSA